MGGTRTTGRLRKWRPRRQTTSPRAASTRARWLLTAVLPVLIWSSAVIAADTAREILDRQKRLDDTERHWNDRYQRLKMHIVLAGGKTLERELDVYERRYANDEQKAIVFLRAPAEIKGTALLAFTHRAKAAEQWLYLPAYKRAREISPDARNERFVSSDLTYNDIDILTELPTWSESDATSRLRGEETLDGTPCYVIERAPTRAGVAYERIVVWLGRDDLVARQLEFYSRAAPSGWLNGLAGGSGSDEPSKRIRQHDIRTVGAIPVAYRVDVENVETGGTTTIDLTDVQFNQNLPDDLFTQRALERGGK